MGVHKTTICAWAVALVLGTAAETAAPHTFPRVWTSVSGCRTVEEFERMAADCAAHGVQVVKSHGGDAKLLAAQLAICRKYGLKMFFGIEDASKTDRNAKSSGLYELAVMSGGCYRGLAIDRNLFSFTPGRHEIIIEPPVYSRNQAYAKHPHYYMLGDGHYFGGYVPTGKAEVVVPERLSEASCTGADASRHGGGASLFRAGAHLRGWRRYAPSRGCDSLRVCAYLEPGAFPRIRHLRGAAVRVGGDARETRRRAGAVQVRCRVR